MTGPPEDRAARRTRARHEDEETRYRAVAGLDPAERQDVDVLLAALADPSWRVRVAAVERLGEGPPAVVPRLVETLASGPGVGAREAAASALARIGAPAVPSLVEKLGSDDPELRQSAAAVLGSISDRRSVAPLAARLADQDPNVRGAAAEALGKIGGPEATAALRAAVDSDDCTLRLCALEALVAVGETLPAARAEALLADRVLRRPVYRLLGACGEPGALALLGRGLSDPSRSAREAALGALGQQRSLRSPESLRPALDEARAAAARDPGLCDSWAGALASDDPAVGAGAVTALAAVGASRHAGAIVRLAENQRLRPFVEEALEALPADADLRSSLAAALPGLGQVARLTALAALARLGSAAALEGLVRNASDPEAYAQGEAIAALGRLQDHRAVAPLAGLLGDEAPSVAGAAAAALVRIGQARPEGRAEVLSSLRDRATAGPSASLYRVLGALGEARDVGILRDGLRSESMVRRGAAASAAGALALRGAIPGVRVPELLAALSDPASPVRAAAARALGAHARATVDLRRDAADDRIVGESIAALAAALRDAEPAVRAAAAEALGACGGPDCAAAIAALADDPGSPPLVVVSAIHALAEMGSPPGAVIARAARHPDPEVVKEAVLAAARMPGPEGERLVREAAASSRWDVRQVAARAMSLRGDPALVPDAERLAATEEDPLVARAFAEAARALRDR